MLAPEKFDSKRAVYSQLATILEPSDVLRQIRLWDIDLVGPNSEFVTDLPRLEPERSYENIRIGGEFYQEVIPLKPAP